MRFAYFAQAGESAGRYGIEFDEIVVHLWRSRGGQRPLALNSIRHVDDLVHAVACLQRVGPAWSDLVERHEPVLVRRGIDRFGEMHAILLVRRMFATLRQQLPARPTGGGPSLHGYVGDRPLRTWLAERVMDQLHRQHTVWCEPAGERGGPATIHRSLPLLGPDGVADEPCCLPFRGEPAQVVGTDS